MNNIFVGKNPDCSTQDVVEVMQITWTKLLKLHEHNLNELLWLQRLHYSNEKYLLGLTKLLLQKVLKGFMGIMLIVLSNRTILCCTTETYYSTQSILKAEHFEVFESSLATEVST